MTGFDVSEGMCVRLHYVEGKHEEWGEYLDWEEYTRVDFVPGFVVLSNPPEAGLGQTTIAIPSRYIEEVNVVRSP